MSQSSAVRHRTDRNPGVCRRTPPGVRVGSRRTSRAQSRIRAARSAGSPGTRSARIEAVAPRDAAVHLVDSADAVRRWDKAACSPVDGAGSGGLRR